MNCLPRFLYHGTAAIFSERILSEGLPPAARRPDGKWSPDIGMVFLGLGASIAYAVGDKAAYKEIGLNGAIYEIDTHRLPCPLYAAPRPFHYMLRAKMDSEEQCFFESLADTDKWRFFEKHWLATTSKSMPDVVVDSLRGYGEICYRGTVPASAISRIAFVGTNDFQRWFKVPDFFSHVHSNYNNGTEVTAQKQNEALKEIFDLQGVDTKKLRELCF